MDMAQDLAGDGGGGCGEGGRREGGREIMLVFYQRAVYFSMATISLFYTSRITYFIPVMPEQNCVEF